ncbi:unnamed protein product [Scytosiphon promiscuus]
MSVNLTSRVQSYFSSGASDVGHGEDVVFPGGNLSRRISVMTTLVENIEYIATASGAEALVLEASLIRLHQPPFNVLLKDDKRNYPYVCVTWSEPYPRLVTTREKPRRGGGPEDRYYGPFVDPGQLKSTIALVRRVLPLRERARPLYKDKPCLNYDMGLCPGACQGLVSEEEYAETVRLAEMVFRGEGGVLLSRLQRRMESESRAERFERAGEIQEQMALVRGGLLGSALHFSSGGVAAGGRREGLMPGGWDSSAEGGGFRRDVVAVGIAGGLACFQVFQVRGGRMTGRLGFTYRVEGEGLSRGEILQACLERYWEDALKPGSTEASGGGGGGSAVGAVDVPEEVVTADALPGGGAALLSEILSGAKRAAAEAQRRAETTDKGEGCATGTLDQVEEDAGGNAPQQRGGGRRRKRRAEKDKGGRSLATSVRIVHGGSGTGERHHLCVMVLKNAELEAKRLVQSGRSKAQGLTQLERMLGLASTPARIEGYDVSHTGGGQAVASVVCFVDGKVAPKNHRRYKIRSPGVRKGHSDDYASLREVIARRFSPAQPPSQPPSPTVAATGGVAPDTPVPDLVVIDGGKGQLSAALDGAAMAADAWLSVERSRAAARNADGVFDERVATGQAAALPEVDGETTTFDGAGRAGASASSSSAPRALNGDHEGNQEDPDAVLLATPASVNEVVGAAAGGGSGWRVDVGGGRRVTFISLAKKEEEVFVPGASEPLAAALEAGPTSPGVLLLRQVRDEAHRFAVAYHRKLRGKDMFLPGRDVTGSAEELDNAGEGSELQGFESIPGLSSKTREELANSFGSLADARTAGEAELRRIPGVGPVLAKRILA